MVIVVITVVIITSTNTRNQWLHVIKNAFDSECASNQGGSTYFSLSRILNTFIYSARFLICSSLSVPAAHSRQIVRLIAYSCLVHSIAMVSTLKLAKITPYGVELPLTKVRIPLLSPVPLSSLSAASMQIAMEDANIIQHDPKICFHYKDEDDDLVLITDVHAAWPQGSDTDTVVKAWFSSAPLPSPPEQEPPTVAAKRDHTAVCKGPHMHQPCAKRIKKLNEEEFKGYSMLEAASAGCHRCVEYWLNRDVDANFFSTNQQYTAMDFILWSKEQGKVSDSIAASVVSVLEEHGGRTNKMK